MNAGTWMWMSCSSFFQSIFHLYCPVNFGRKVDANGDYIRKYLPVFKNFPTKYIHEPWMAPLAVQEKSKCIIGKDYPLPIVNHVEAAKTNLERMRQVFNKLSIANGVQPSSLPSNNVQQQQRQSVVPNQLNLKLEKKSCTPIVFVPNQQADLRIAKSDTQLVVAPTGNANNSTMSANQTNSLGLITNNDDQFITELN